ncbi:MAG TPA: long-chain fatty acid--CoA ligase [Bacillales bacterium]|nr:long-chain fatty acid--CoA ligase [Bacillales bacterium]
MKPKNLVEVVHQSVERYPDKAALMWKSGGSYKSLMYRSFWEDIRHVAAGLAQLGVGWDDKVAILSENNPQWPITDLAISSLGAVSVPIYPSLPPGQAAFILKNADCQTAVVQNGEQLQKVLEGGAGVANIVVIEPADHSSKDVNVLSISDVAKMGKEKPLENWEETWRKIDRDRLATIIHTSGTTGKPKGAMLTHGNFLANIEGVQFWVLEARPDDIMLSYLPLSHVFERMAGQFMPLSAGSTIAYAESIDNIPDNLVEVKPTVMTTVPLLLERVYAKVQDEINGGSSMKKKVFDWATRVGMERYDYYLNQPADILIQKELPPKLRKRWNRADRLVYQKVKQKLGGRLRGLVSGGGALNPEIGRFFWSIDIPVLEGYGLTETAPVVAANPIIRTKIGTVGKPLPNLEVRTAPDGEVLVKGPNVMKGYYKNEKATAEAFDGEWYRTGDLGQIDEEGYLKIIDRKKRIIILTTGKNVAPQPVENAIQQSSYIEYAMLVGYKRKYVIALVSPSFENLEPWAVKKGLPTDSHESLIRYEAVQKLLHDEVERLTASFASFEQPKKTIICSKTWTIDTGELTPSMKVRVNEVEKKYASIIEMTYTRDALSGAEIAADEVAASIQQVGRKQ